MSARRRPPRYPLVMVEWVDSGAVLGWNEFNVEHVAAMALGVFSVGWLVHRDAQKLTLVSHAAMTAADQIDNAHSPMTIPRVAVVRLTTLRRAPRAARGHP